MPNGGARPGAGRKPQAEKPGIKEPSAPQIPKAPGYFKHFPKHADQLPGLTDLFNETVTFLKRNSCATVVPGCLIANHALASYSSINAQYEWAQYPITPKDNEYGELMLTYSEIIRTMQECVLLSWQPIQTIIDWHRKKGKKGLI